MKRYKWLILSLLMLAPAANIGYLIDLQLSLWMFIVDIPKPNPVLLFASFYYWPVLFALTGWYWIWRTARWLFEDEGPLPKFRLLLVIMWSPVWVIPIITSVSLLGWIACLIKAYSVEVKDGD